MTDLLTGLRANDASHMFRPDRKPDPYECAAAGIVDDGPRIPAWSLYAIIGIAALGSLVLLAFAIA